MRTVSKYIVLARFKKWVPEELWNDLGPKAEDLAFFHIHCGNTFSSGHRCGFELGAAEKVDPDRPSDVLLAGGFTYADRAGIAYVARSEVGPPALNLQVSRRAHRPVGLTGTAPCSDASEEEARERIWVALHWDGYRWVRNGEYFEILKPHKFGLRGHHSARRALPGDLAAKLEAEINQNTPRQEVLTVGRGVLGDTPRLPALILCPRCSTPERLVLNEVLPPTLD